MAFNLFGKKNEKKKKPAAPVALKKDEEAPVPAARPVSVSRPMRGKTVLHHMHVSEKSAQGEAISQYTFIVEPTSTKNEIAKAVASKYGVQVKAVNITRLPSKKRRLGRFVGSTKSKKKAVVTLHAGQQIASGV